MNGPISIISNAITFQMMCKSGLSHIITMDLHQKEIQGFFDCPVDNLRASPFLLQYIQESVNTTIPNSTTNISIKLILPRFQIIETPLSLLETQVPQRKRPHMPKDFVWELQLFTENKKNRKVMRSMVDIHHRH